MAKIIYDYDVFGDTVIEGHIQTTQPHDEREFPIRVRLTNVFMLNYIIYPMLDGTFQVDLDDDETLSFPTLDAAINSLRRLERE